MPFLLLGYICVCRSWRPMGSRSHAFTLLLQAAMLNTLADDDRSGHHWSFADRRSRSSERGRQQTIAFHRIDHLHAGQDRLEPARRCTAADEPTTSRCVVTSLSCLGHTFLALTVLPMVVYGFGKRLLLRPPADSCRPLTTPKDFLLPRNLQASHEYARCKSHHRNIPALVFRQVMDMLIET